MLNKSQIDKIFKEGKRSYGSFLKIISLPGTGEVIISAPIKTFKRAVDRNRVKRLIREAIRGIDFSKVDAFIIYNIPEIKSLDEIKIDLQKIKF